MNSITVVRLCGYNVLVLDLTVYHSSSAMWLYTLCMLVFVLLEEFGYVAILVYIQIYHVHTVIEITLFVFTVCSWNEYHTPQKNTIVYANPGNS